MLYPLSYVPKKVRLYIIARSTTKQWRGDLARGSPLLSTAHLNDGDVRDDGDEDGRAEQGKWLPSY
jgi:hypothetical protein